MSSAENVPVDLLLDFFSRAIAATVQLQLDTGAADETKSLSELRQLLLTKQIESLQAAIDDYNCNDDNDLTVEILQEAVGQSSKHPSPEVLSASTALNEAARLAFCRLVLHSEFLQSKRTSNSHNSSRDLKDSGQMESLDVLEFCGLCEAAVRLPFVLEYLRNKGATPLFDGDTAAPTIFPQMRLERIQRMFLCALGYDADFGTRDIKRRFYEGNEEQQASLQKAFVSMAATMDAVLAECTAAATNDAFFGGESVNDDDGVTKVVSVKFSEKLIDSETGEEIQVNGENDADEAPRPESMAGNKVRENAESAGKVEQQRQEEFRVARQASVLQQEILGELLSMRDEDRDVKLQAAKEAATNALSTAARLPGSERVKFLTSLDSYTQRLMVMHQLWTGMLAQNGGKPPNIR